MEAYYINLIPERGTPVFHVSQGDTDRIIRCDLYDGVKAVKLTEADGIVLSCKKPDGNAISIAVTNTKLTYVDIPIPSTITDIVGKVYCKLRINNIGAKAFQIEVEGRP